MAVEAALCLVQYFGPLYSHHPDPARGTQRAACEVSIREGLMGVRLSEAMDPQPELSNRARRGGRARTCRRCRAFWRGAGVAAGQVWQPSVLLAHQNNEAVRYGEVHPVALRKKYRHCPHLCQRIRLKFEIKWYKIGGLIVYCHLSVRGVLLRMA